MSTKKKLNGELAKQALFHIFGTIWQSFSLTLLCFYSNFSLKPVQDFIKSNSDRTKNWLLEGLMRPSCGHYVWMQPRPSSLFSPHCNQAQNMHRVRVLEYGWELQAMHKHSYTITAGPRFLNRHGYNRDCIWCHTNTIEAVLQKYVVY